MAGAQQLLGVVSKVRRRLRLQVGLSGLLAGLVVALAAGELMLVLAMASRRGDHGQRPGVLVARGLALLLVGAAAGALIWCRRHRAALTISAAARRVDESIAGRIGGERLPSNGDRVLVALGLIDMERESRLAGAAVEQAAAEAAPLVPAEVVPWRAPPVPWLLASCLLMAAAVPLGLTARKASMVPGSWTGTDGLDPAAGAAAGREARLAAARREARALEALAGKLGDEQLAASARALAARIDKLAAGAGELDAAALEGLMAESRAAAEEARAAAVRGRSGAPAQAGNAGERETQPATAALTDEQTKRRLGGLHGDKAATAGPQSGAEGEGSGQEPAQKAEQERRLRRLGRGLDERPPPDTGGPAGGPQPPGSGSGAGQPGMAGPGGERTAQAGEGSGRASAGASPGGTPAGNAPSSRGGTGAEPSALAEFERGARGGAGASAPQGDPGKAAGENQRGQGSPGASGGGQPASGGSGQAAGPPGATGTASTGEAGAASDTAGQGRALQAEVAEGPGPSRAESIALGAEHGFSDRGYDRTYKAYRAAVEQTLDLAAVPEGRARLVRRYFDLIRPRAGR